jgi:Uma2 family endonuclease
MNTRAEPRPHRWTRADFYKIDEIGLFSHTHFELIDGQIIEGEYATPRQAATISMVGDRLRRVFEPADFVRILCQLDLDEWSQPQPDIALVAGTPYDYEDAHPTTATLVVEVADTSLAFDHTFKTGVYAKAGIAEYWIINLIDRQLEVYRQPGVNAAAVYGFGYGEKLVFRLGDAVAPLAKPEARIAVADLLP